jgi:hypothetical protein
MIKNIGDNYRTYGLIIVKTAKKSLVLDYGLLDATFELPTMLSKLNPNLKTKTLILTPKIKTPIQTLNMKP